MFGATVLPAKLMMSQRGNNKKIALVTTAPAYAGAFQRALADMTRDLHRAEYAVETVTPGTPEQEKDLRARVEKGGLDGFLVATDAALATRRLTYYARATTDLMEGGLLARAAQQADMEQQLGAAGVSREKIAALLSEKIDVETQRLSAGKSVASSGRTAFFLTFGLVMTLYMSIILHGVAVMRSVLEEKTSRIVEVLLAAVTPKELMAGKILGVGAVGLTQLAFWYGSGAVLGIGMAAQIRMLTGSLDLPVLPLALFPLFFLLGYFLYAALWAMLGAMVNSEQEAQQMQFFVVFPLFVSLILMGPTITNPNSALAVSVSLIPFCTPLLLYVRIAAGDVPAWQIGLGVALMLLTIWLTLVVASRIYRVGILMYGKRPTLPELIKWFRYA
jgi:ABC-2 type transport system permease protein